MSKTKIKMPNPYPLPLAPHVTYSLSLRFKATGFVEKIQQGKAFISTGYTEVIF